MAQKVNKKQAKQACEEVQYRALYGYYFLGLSKTHLSKTFHKSIPIITNWITHFEDTMDRPNRIGIPLKFNMTKRQFLVNLYHENPILYIDEAKKQFQDEFNMTISTACICKILYENNMSWEKLEKRVIEIKFSEVVKFMADLNAIDWCYMSLVFLDEVSMDNEGLLRTKGYGVIDEKLIYRGESTRKPLLSMLAFLGQTGILDTYVTTGTFNRRTFVEYCRDFALGGSCQQYPGRNSVWLLDDAKIHLDPHFVRYLRSLGILPIFLPGYTPFFNPLEYIFDEVKKNLTLKSAGSRKNMELLVNEEFTKMQNFPCTNIFKKCGFVMSGKFDPSVGYEHHENDFGFKSTK